MPAQEDHDAPLRFPGEPAREELLAMLDGATRAAQAKPGSAMRHSNRALLLIWLDRAGEALEAADEAVKAGPGTGDAHVVRGIALHSLGRIEDALRSFDRAIEIDPGRDDARNNRGNALVDLGRHGEAIRELDRVIGMAPKDPAAHANRGRALYWLGHMDDAVESQRRAISLGYDGARAWLDLAAMLFQAGRMRESLAAADSGIKAAPDRARGHYTRWIILRRLGRSDGARESFGRARELDPAFPDPAHPDDMDDVYLAWNEAMDTRNRLAAPTGPKYLLQHHIRSRIAEFLNAAKRALEYHEKQNKSGILGDFHSLRTRAKIYIQYVNMTKHECLLDVRITKTGQRKEVYPSIHTGYPVIMVEEGAGTSWDGMHYGANSWTGSMLRGDVGKGFAYEAQVCHVVLKDGEVELVEFMDTVLGGVRELLAKHGYGTSALDDHGSYYGMA